MALLGLLKNRGFTIPNYHWDPVSIMVHSCSVRNNLEYFRLQYIKSAKAWALSVAACRINQSARFQNQKTLFSKTDGAEMILIASIDRKLVLWQYAISSKS